MGASVRVERAVVPLVASVALAALSLVLLSGCADRGHTVQGARSPSAAVTVGLPTPRHLLTLPRPPATAGFFFASGKVFWATLPVGSSGLSATYGRAFSFDPATSVMTPLRRLARAMASHRVSAMAFAPGRVAILAETPIFRAADGPDGFRGVLGQPLFTGTFSGSALQKVGPASIAFVGNGGIASRSWLLAFRHRCSVPRRCSTSGMTSRAWPPARTSSCGRREEARAARLPGSTAQAAMRLRGFLPPRSPLTRPSATMWSSGSTTVVATVRRLSMVLTCAAAASSQSRSTRASRAICPSMGTWSTGRTQMGLAGWRSTVSGLPAPQMGSA